MKSSSIVRSSFMYSAFLLLLQASITTAADQQETSNGHASLRKRPLQKPPKEQEVEKSDKNNSNEFSSAEAQEVLSLTSYMDIYHYYDCGDVFSKMRPIHSQDTWKKLRELYKTKFAMKKSNVFYPDPSTNDFSVPYEVKQTTDGKGRGIFATKDVKKGQRIWGTSSTAIFDATGTEYKKFLLSLDDDFVCDALQCSYMQKDQHNEMNWYIAVDLDEGCFCNDGNYAVVNKGCDEDAAKDLPGGCTSNYFALTDIKAGDEFLCDYSELDYDWDQFYFLELE